METIHKKHSENHISGRILFNFPHRGRSFSLSQEEAGAPGIQNILVTVGLTEKEGRAESEAKLRDNSTREWTVIASMSKSIDWDRNISFSIDSENSCSFIEVPKEFETSQIQSKDGNFVFYKNTKNEISTIRFTCIAPSMHEARKIFINGIYPILDYFSYAANVPIFINQILTTDSKHGIFSLSYETPYKNVILLPHESTIIDGMEPIYALYREAKTNNSVFYKFLCYYKIMEGIYNTIRPNIRTKAKALNIQLHQNKEVVPEDVELNKFMPGVIGKNIREIYDNTFTPKFRNSIAHFILSDGKVLNISDYHSHADFQNVIHLIEICSRVLIENQINIINQLINGKST